MPYVREFRVKGATVEKDGCLIRVKDATLIETGHALYADFEEARIGFGCRIYELH